MRRLLVLTCLLVVATAMPAAADLLTPTLTVEPDVTTTTLGQSITVSGALTDPPDTLGASIVIARSSDGGATWTPADGSPATTASDGTFSASDQPPAAGTYAYKASWDGDTVTYGPGEATSTQTLTVSLPDSTLEVEPASTASFVGQPVNIVGSITDPPDIEGVSIVIERAPDGVTFAPIATSPATTDANGAFSAADTPPAGTYTYRASWDGDGLSYGPGSADSSTNLTVSKWPSDLTLHASASKIVYGDPVRLSGLWSSDSGVAPADANVTISRAKTGGSTVERGATLSDVDRYKYWDTPGSAGTFTYTASWAGDVTHESQTSANVEVVVSKRATTLVLDATRGTVVYGDTTTLVATLRHGEAGSKVRFEKRSNGSWNAIGAVEISKDRTARLKISPQSKQTYRAVFDATANLKGSTSDTVTVQVRPIMVSRMIGKFTRVGGYAVYKCCTAYFYVKLKPIHPRLSWTATVQYYGNGKWRALGSGSYRFEADGDSAIYLNAVKGYRYRVRGHFDGDGDHLPATSAWNYFKFT